MKALSLRNIPDDVYEELRRMARENRRSLQEQVRYLLEREVRLVRESPASRAVSWRKKLAGRRFSDTVTQIRRDRNR